MAELDVAPRTSLGAPSRLPAVLAFAGAALAAAAVALVATVLLASHSVGVDANVFVATPGIITENNSPKVVRNPTRPTNLVEVHRIDRPRFGAALDWSVDDGRTWRSTPLRLPAGLDRPYAPDAAFAPDGTLYVLYVNLVGRGNGPDTLWLSRSTDGGRTLSDPIPVTRGLAFQGRIAVAPDGTIVVTWLQATDTGILSFVGPLRLVAVRSTDAGHTFSPPVTFSDPSRRFVGAATPVFDSRGTLDILYEDFKDDVRDFENLEGPPWPRPFALVLTQSHDAGRTFAPGREIDSDVIAAHRFLAYLPEFPSIAAGPNGSLDVAWSDARTGTENVYFRRSADGGKTWSAPVRVSTDPVGRRVSHYLPTVAVAPNGRVDILFLDRRNDPQHDVLTDAYLATSMDDGRTFRDLRVSSTSFDSRIGSSASADLPIDFGTRLGLASRDDEAYAVWTDSRFGDASTARQDVLGARVTFPDTTNGGRVVAAVVLLVGAALCLGAALGLRRRATPRD